MKWKTLIQDLLNAGMTQVAIADGIGLKQPSIVDILQEKTKSVRWETGDAIIKMHRRVMRTRTPKPPAEQSASEQVI